jgi:hypothetical protein
MVPPLFVGVHDDFCVGVCAEAVTERRELGSQLGEVANLSVEDDPHRRVFVGDGLTASGEIDDAQTATSEADALIDVEAVSIGASMDERCRHRREESRINRLSGCEVELAGDATHCQDATS